jgi:hypothetical protein
MQCTARRRSVRNDDERMFDALVVTDFLAILGYFSTFGDQRRWQRSRGLPDNQIRSMTGPSVAQPQGDTPEAVDNYQPNV